MFHKTDQTLLLLPFCFIQTISDNYEKKTIKQEHAALQIDFKNIPIIHEKDA